MSAAPLFYPFGGGASVPPAGKDILGDKGAGLAEMAAAGLPVPPGFTIPASLCHVFFENGMHLPASLWTALQQGLRHIESVSHRGFGAEEDPLLVSVRSGARVPMPGMMDTILNLGLNDRSVRGLAQKTSDPRFAFDSYRRLIQMYGSVVFGIEPHFFEDALERLKEERDMVLDTELDAPALEAVAAAFLAIVEEQAGVPFPQDVEAQLQGAVAAVFRSWDSERARVYRQLNHIPAEWGTAVTVQAMVFGNRGRRSATGVAYTRNPVTGAREICGEYLLNAQGEDVLAGIRTPRYLTEEARKGAGGTAPSLEEAMPKVFEELTARLRQLEQLYRQFQDVEFTIEEGTLFLLQSRVGKRPATALLRMTCEMVDEGLLSQEEALLRIDPQLLEQMLHPTVDPSVERQLLASGLPASPGAASGIVVLSSKAAERRAAAGENVILVRLETSPEDIGGMYAARGILTARGGMTSHAAVVARGMGRPCVVGARQLVIDHDNNLLRIDSKIFHEGDAITIDGASGDILEGAVATVEPQITGNFSRLMEWADARRRLKVRANAETPTDCRVARRFGAEGIGLVRTEHMFFSPDRIVHVRAMILAESVEERREELEKILPMQRSDFMTLFRIMAGLPVTIRLLDPPLHEFLPQDEEEFEEISATLGVSTSSLRQRLKILREVNPMLGMRGCRLGIIFPEVVTMQARAVFEAAAAVDTACPEIMVPLAATRQELALTRQSVEESARETFIKTGKNVHYHFGTMIELPRAALLAGKLAEVAEFFSFGTNDLTQTTLGLSRDDAGRFLQTYVEAGVYPTDPFVTLDINGVGELLRIAVARGRRTRPELDLGICGEHGGDPATIHFCEEIGLDYVSCSPWRVPVARLAAAQAAILHGRQQQEGGAAETAG